MVNMMYQHFGLTLWYYDDQIGDHKGKKVICRHGKSFSPLCILSQLSQQFRDFVINLESFYINSQLVKIGQHAFNFNNCQSIIKLVNFVPRIKIVPNARTLEHRVFCRNTSQYINMNTDTWTTVHLQSLVWMTEPYGLSQSNVSPVSRRNYYSQSLISLLLPSQKCVCSYTQSHI